MSLSKGLYLIREGFRSIKTHGFMSFASVAIITACLIIIGSITLLSLNIDKLIADLEQQNEIVAFVDESIADEETAKALESSILAVGNIESAEFVSRENAMKNFMSKYDDRLMEGIDASVFRHRFVLHLTDISQMAETKKALEAVPGILKVNAQIEYADRFVRVRNIVSVISLILTAVLTFVSFFIMSNTIKLTTYGRREEIAIMKMVGATNAFIRTPFVIEGLILGLLGGLFGFLIQWLLYTLLNSSLMDTLTGSFVTLVPFKTVMWPLLAAFLGIGVLIGVFGGLNAIRNYLKV
ncbi:MAG: permease-like cell division protein FtsX [Oscillospiraceae bacterium]|jgi:cell division transport system permease protein|nr:permease-like cell division protein FtsX [Oscillospiraceae bacterium]MBQ1579258.1 permease-like cell division protein FtsX [Oscillospiraceae bacterium]MBQ5787902.1 permease-like cell division protein FtsX [Oscillospiraceae bacterium]MDO5458744.1 permease-like cell division protein FtsX [Eubacteriales bacterium]